AHPPPLAPVYPDACPPDLSGSQRVVRVVPQLRRQVERDREPRLAWLEQETEGGVRLLGRAVARVLANGPRPTAVHRRVRAARVRILARELERVDRGVSCGVDGLHLYSGVGQPAVSGRRGAHLRIVWRALVLEDAARPLEGGGGGA